MMPITINDVAKAAQVSRTAVSAVLGRYTSNTTVQIGARTRARIIETAKKLGYSTNYLASGLRKGKTNTIGLILESFGVEVTQQKAEGVEQTAYENGYRVFTCFHCNNLEREEADIRDLLARRVDGLILYPFLDGRHEQIEKLVEAKFPLVTFYGDLSLPVNSVTVDNEYGAWLAVKHLEEIGRTQIAFLGGDLRYHSMQARLAGWKRGCREAGLDFEAMTFLGFETAEAEEAGYQGCHSLLESGREFNAIAASNDLIALGAYKALHDKGLRVPGDVAVIGFDDNRFIRYLPVPLTSIRQPAMEVGQKAFSLLLRQIQNPDLPPEKISLPPTLIVRQSTMVATRP